MIVLTPPPKFHTGPQDTCARCEWQRKYFALKHWIRIRGEFKV